MKLVTSKPVYLESIFKSDIVLPILWKEQEKKKFYL